MGVITSTLLNRAIITMSFRRQSLVVENLLKCRTDVSKSRWIDLQIRRLAKQECYTLGAVLAKTHPMPQVPAIQDGPNIRKYITELAKCQDKQIGGRMIGAFLKREKDTGFRNLREDGAPVLKAILWRYAQTGSVRFDSVVKDFYTPLGLTKDTVFYNMCLYHATMLSHEQREIRMGRVLEEMAQNNVPANFASAEVVYSMVSWWDLRKQLAQGMPELLSGCTSMAFDHAFHGDDVKTGSLAHLVRLAHTDPEAAEACVSTLSKKPDPLVVDLMCAMYERNLLFVRWANWLDRVQRLGVDVRVWRAHLDKALRDFRATKPGGIDMEVYERLGMDKLSKGT